MSTSHPDPAVRREMNPADVSDELVSMACGAAYGGVWAFSDERYLVSRALAAVLPEFERQVRERIVADLAAERQKVADNEGVTQATANPADFERARSEEMRRILRERQQRPSRLMAYGDWPPVATINKSFKVREPERIDWAAFRRRAWDVVIMYVLIADLGLLLIAARDG